MAKGKDYLGIGGIVSVILAIIPPTSWVLGVVTRAMEGKWLAVIIRLFLGFNILWILDIIFMVKDGKIFRLL